MTADEPSEVTEPAYGDTWVYEGIIGALPGISLAPRTALVVQFLLFGSNIEVVLAVLAFCALVTHTFVVTALSVTLLSVRQNKPLAVDA